MKKWTVYANGITVLGKDGILCAVPQDENDQTLGGIMENARLIAAAPELLEAVKALSLRLESVLRFSNAGESEMFIACKIANHPDLILARAAIAKAEGR